VQPEDVPAGPLAVDTDVFSWVWFRRARHVEWAALLEGRPLALAFPVVGAVRGGAMRKLGEKRMAELDRGLSRYVVLPGDSRVVDKWSELHARFVGRLKGEGINDMWIAACCLVHNLPLATGNLTDFTTIAGEFPLRLVHSDL
jgi:predicted nucleic acid-binding protein